MERPRTSILYSGRSPPLDQGTQGLRRHSSASLSLPSRLDLSEIYRVAKDGLNSFFPHRPTPYYGFCQSEEAFILAIERDVKPTSQYLKSQLISRSAPIFFMVSAAWNAQTRSSKIGWLMSLAQPCRILLVGSARLSKRCRKHTKSTGRNWGFVKMVCGVRRGGGYYMGGNGRVVGCFIDPSSANEVRFPRLLPNPLPP